MKKIKPEVKKNKFSWEARESTRFCDANNCMLEGKYRAPKSILNLRDYYFFCLKHVKEYNKSWDYYKGMNVTQIENSIRQDVIWNRPSWPTKGSHQIIMDAIDNIFNVNINFFNNDKNANPFIENSNIYQNFTPEEEKSLEILGINVPINLEKIKSSYKKLVKKYHPDVNKDDKNAEKNFKKVNSAYKVLLKKLMEKNQ